MAMAQQDEPLRLPTNLQLQLYGFRRRVWTVKMAEAVGVAVFTVVVAFLCVFGLDRVADTPSWLRWAIFFGALGGCALVPLHAHHWIWRHRRLEQLARLLSVKLPRLGDELLGIVELVHSENEQTRSRVLCVAAIRQVTDDAAKRNLDDAAPNSRHRDVGNLRRGRCRGGDSPGPALSARRPPTHGRGCLRLGQTRPATRSPSLSRCPRKSSLRTGSPSA